MTSFIDWIGQGHPVGTWHLGKRAAYPERHGFDVNIGGCEQGMPMQGYFSPYGIPTLDEPPEDGVYLTDYLTDHAAGLIDAHAAGDPV